MAAAPDDEALVRFMAALRDGRAAARMLFSLSDTLDIRHWPRHHGALAALDRTSVAVVPTADAAWLGSHYGIRAVFGDPFEVEILLPAAFGSPDGARQLLRAAGKPYLAYMPRVRVILVSLCEMLLAGRIELILAVRRRLGALPRSLLFRVSPEDGCPDTDVATLSRPFGAANLLIPDGYYHEHDGYAAHKERVASAPRPWAGRRDTAIWRGTTTGSAYSKDDLDANERIRLAAYCAARPDLFDARISGIAQVPPADVPVVRALLEARGLYADPLPMDAFRQHKFAIHIDGNTSAAGFAEKMALGCCVLRVPSRFEQWIEPRIEPWVHFVPLRPDHSDLIEKVEMLIRMPDLAERIARTGYAFMVEADFGHEAQVFCRDLVDTIGVTQMVRLSDRAGPGGRAGPAVPETVVRLTAPPADDPDRDGAVRRTWFQVETLGPHRWRWTRADRVAWQVAPRDAPGGLRIEVPFLNEVRGNFAASARLELMGRSYPVSIQDGVLFVSVNPEEAFDGHVVLVTPPPCCPREMGRGNDGRFIGLGIVAA